MADTRFWAWLLESMLFPRLTDALDYSTCARAAATNRAAAAVWARYVAHRDLPRRLVRFYRGVGLRSAAALVRSMPRVETAIIAAGSAAAAAARVERVMRVPPPSRYSVATNDECVAETLYAGLAATDDELDALGRLGLITCDAPRRRREWAMVSRLHLSAPHRVASTQARLLVPSADELLERWRTLLESAGITQQHILVATEIDGGGGSGADDDGYLPSLPSLRALRHGARVTTAVDVVLDSLPAAAVPTTVANEARAGMLAALAYVVEAYCAVTGRVPRLVAELFGNDTDRAERAVAADRTNVAAAVVLHAAASAWLAFRVRSRARTLEPAPLSRVPAMVDARAAWQFTVANGLVLTHSPAMDAVVHRNVHARLECEFALGHFLCADRYLRGALTLDPWHTANERMRSNDFSWLSTRVEPSQARAIVELFSHAGDLARSRRKRRLLHAGHIVSFLDGNGGVDGSNELPPLYCALIGSGALALAMRRDAKHVDSLTAATESAATDIASAAQRVRESGFRYVVAVVQRVPLDQSFVIRWSEHALQLSPFGRTLRCRLLDALLAWPARFSLCPLPRCDSCGRSLRNARSVAARRGPCCSAGRWR